MPPHLPTLAAMRWMIALPALWAQVFLLSPDLPKVPALFHHFLEHRHVHGDLGLWAFLADHYGEHGSVHQEQPGHDALPFHHHHNDATVDQCMTKLLASEPCASMRLPERQGMTPSLPLPGAGLSPGFHSAPLQPPRPLA